MCKDNRGMTLIELIIAIAMSVFVFGAASLLLYNSQKNYQTANETIDLQTESQVLMEQLGMWIMEGNRIEVQNVGECSTLTVWEIPREVPDYATEAAKQEEEFAKKRVIYQKEGKLYTRVWEDIEDPDEDALVANDLEAEDEYCIGDYVTVFTPEFDEESTGVVLAMTLEHGRQTYEISDEIKVRNALV